MAETQQAPQTNTKQEKINKIFAEIDEISEKAIKLLKATNMINVSYEGVSIHTFISDIVGRTKQIAELAIQ